MTFRTEFTSQDYFRNPAAEIGGAGLGQRVIELLASRPFQSQASKVWRLILSDGGELTATIQLFLLNSIATSQRTVSSWDPTGGRVFTVWASFTSSYALVGREKPRW
jgi:hypothetical protein